MTPVPPSPESRIFQWHPDAPLFERFGDIRVEGPDAILDFAGKSAAVVRAARRIADGRTPLGESAEGTGFSAASLCAHLETLADDGFVLETTTTRTGAVPDMARTWLRSAARFWNSHVAVQPLPLRIEDCTATRDQIFGWGIEFHHYVAGANLYMARGAARARGPAPAALRRFWSHYVEEHDHARIFRNGLIGCGVSESRLNRRPLPSTSALLHYLFEVAEEGPIPYAAVFAVMQPLERPPARADVAARYERLAAAYPYAAPMFEAFRTHDSIDADLEHSQLLLAELFTGDHVSADFLDLALRTMRRTAAAFCLFWSGIERAYGRSVDADFRPSANVEALRPGSPLRYPAPA